jgi:hypothetical protein
MRVNVIGCDGVHHVIIYKKKKDEIKFSFVIHFPEIKFRKDVK